MKGNNNLKDFIKQENEKKAAFLELKSEQRSQHDSRLKRLIIDFRKQYPNVSDYDILEKANEELGRIESEEIKAFDSGFDRKLRK